MWDLLISGVLCFISSGLVSIGNRRCKDAAQSRILTPTELADWLAPGHAWYGQVQGSAQFDSSTNKVVNQNQYSIVNNPNFALDKEQFISQAYVVDPFSITDNKNTIRVIPDQLMIDTQQKTTTTVTSPKSFTNSAIRISEQSIANNEFVYMIGQASKDLAGNLTMRAPEDPSYPFAINVRPHWNALDSLSASGQVLQIAGLILGCLGMVAVHSPSLHFPQVLRPAGYYVARRVQTSEIAISVSYTVRKNNGGRILIDEVLEVLRELEYITSTELPAQISESPTSITAVFLYANKQRKSAVRLSFQLISVFCTALAVISITDSFLNHPRALTPSFILR